MENNERPNARHRNPKDMIDEYERTLGLIEKDQISNESEKGSDFEPLGTKDALPSEFTEKGLDAPSDVGIDANPNLPIGKSMNRFSHDLTEQIPDETKDVGQKVRGLTKVAKTDRPSDE